MRNVEVAVLGAGPAGLVAAYQLGQAGVEVRLIDGGPAAAGHAMESFPPSGAPLAEEIGLLQDIYETSDGPAQALHMRWRDTLETRVFEGDGPLLVQRAAMRERLMSRATSPVDCHRTRVRDVIMQSRSIQVYTDAGDFTAELVIDARGRQAKKRASTDLVALPFTAREVVPAHFMYLEALSKGWVWAVSRPEGVLNGVLFQPAEKLAGLDAALRYSYAHQTLNASGLFATAQVLEAGKPVTAGLSAVDDPVVTDRYFLVGDAALARDPIASHGLVHAMRSGVQVAVAAMTVLDPACDSQAAVRFLRHKHREAVAAAKQATANAYADQSNASSSFWSDRAMSLPFVAPNAPLLDGAILTTDLTRAPILQHDRIRWVPAIALPDTQDFMTASGAITALDIASACRPPAPLREIARRLSRRHDTTAVFEVLEKLILAGALVQARRAS